MRAQERDKTPLQGAVPLAQRHGHKDRLRDAWCLGNRMGLAGFAHRLGRIIKHLARAIQGQDQTGDGRILTA